MRLRAALAVGRKSSCWRDAAAGLTRQSEKLTEIKRNTSTEKKIRIVPEHWEKDRRASNNSRLQVADAEPRGSERRTVEFSRCTRAFH